VTTVTVDYSPYTSLLKQLNYYLTTAFSFI